MKKIGLVATLLFLSGVVGCGGPEETANQTANQDPNQDPNQEHNQDEVEVTPLLHASASSVLPGEAVALTPFFVGERAEIAPYFSELTSGEPVEVSPTETTTYTLEVFVGEASATAEVEVEVVEPATLHVVFNGEPGPTGYFEIHGPQGPVASSDQEATYGSLWPGEYTVTAPTSVTDELAFALVSPPTVEVEPGGEATVEVDWYTVLTAPWVEVSDSQSSYVVDVEDGLELEFVVGDLIDDPDDLEVEYQVGADLDPEAFAIVGEGAHLVLEVSGGIHYGDAEVMLFVRNTSGIEISATIPLDFAPWVVTSVDDDGPGTLRAAIGAGGGIVFDEAIHGETIDLDSAIEAASWARVIGTSSDPMILTADGHIFDVQDGGYLEAQGLILRDASRAVNVRSGGEFVAIEVAFLDNEAGSGAGIMNRGVVRVKRSLFVGNISDCGPGCGTGGGAVHSLQTAVLTEISDSVFSGNIARSAGGSSGAAIRLTAGELSLIRSTVTENFCEGTWCGGGAVRVMSELGSAPEAEVMGNIIAGNVGGDHPDLVASGTISLSVTFNILGEINVPNGSVSNSEVGADPQLSELADHGGPFVTYVPLPGSPAVEFLPPTDEEILDARGELRRTGSPGSDAGAVERQVNDPT